MISLILLAALVAIHTPQWHSDGDVDGVPVEIKAVPGSRFPEIRITTTRGETLQALCDAIFAKHVGNHAHGRFKKREVLKETATERWTYEQISVPVFDDRDYVMHIKLVRPASSGRCEIAFSTVDDGSHPPPDGFVRVKEIRGHWSLVPIAGGKVKITYEVFSDPGGHLPAFLVRGPQERAAVGFMKAILARARRKP